MIRIVVIESDYGAAANIGGPVETTPHTFEIDHPEIERLLGNRGKYTTVEIMGAEIFSPCATGEDERDD